MHFICSFAEMYKYVQKCGLSIMAFIAQFIFYEGFPFYKPESTCDHLALFSWYGFVLSIRMELAMIHPVTLQWESSAMIKDFSETCQEWAIIVEGSAVMDELVNLPQASCVLFSLIYTLHLDYPST